MFKYNEKEKWLFYVILYNYKKELSIFNSVKNENIEGCISFFFLI